MRKLTRSEIAEARADLLHRQAWRCALCQLPCKVADAVLDHNHQTGAVRGTLHRSCNALLGKVENNHKRYGVTQLSAFLHGAAAYLQHHSTNVTGLIHPLHKTDEEKRLSRNARARKARAAKKKGT